MDMANDDSYEITPHREIAELKQQLQELRLRIDKVSPKELINSMSTLSKSIESMLKLFGEAVEELKFEDREEALSGGKDTVNQKLDRIMNQNKVIADGIVAVSEMIEDLNGKKSQVSNTQPRFQPPMAQDPGFQQPQFDQPPQPEQGPVAMPNIPFSNLDAPPKPKKKGLFGRLKK
jgi:hypothetical protein